jgi:hypothetical protein
VTYSKLNCVEKVSTSLSRSSSSASVNSNSSSKISNLKTYTNEYFPDFKLVYPEDWKFETSTTPSELNKTILTRKIKLTRGQNALVLDTFILDQEYGCESLDPWIEVKKLNGNLKKFTSEDGKIIQYSNTPDCTPSNSINSNIPISRITNYTGPKVNNNITFPYYIGLEGDYTADSDFIKEVDKVLTQSTFR